MRRSKPVRLQTTITLLVCIVVTLALLITDVLISREISEGVKNNQAEKATIIARTIAHTPLVQEALNGQRNETELQVFANQIRQVAGVEFIVVMDMNGVRKSHPDPLMVGRHFRGGDEKEVLQHGRESISIAEGTLGRSLRAFTPVFMDDGRQVGAVSVGISLNNVQEVIARSQSVIFIGIGFGVLVGMIGAVFLARKVKKIMFGLEPFAIARLLEERSAMLKSAKEGMIAVDQNANITLVNNEAIRLFHQAGMRDNPTGKKVVEYMPGLQLERVIMEGHTVSDQELNLSGITLLASVVPVHVEGNIVGAISTFRDKTEFKQLAEELSGVRLYADALRAQAHEFMNKLQVILGMVHMKCYDQLPDYITRTTQQHQTEVGSLARHIKDPVLAGFFLGKLSYARELGAELVLSDASYVPVPEDPDVIHEIITILGNLINNALEAVHGCAVKRVDVDLDYHEDGILSIEVKDSGPGMTQDIRSRVFEKGFSTKGKDRGVGLFLVRRSIENLKGKMDIYSGEKSGIRFIVHIPYIGKGDET